MIRRSRAAHRIKYASETIDSPLSVKRPTHPPLVAIPIRSAEGLRPRINLIARRASGVGSFYR